MGQQFSTRIRRRRDLRKRIMNSFGVVLAFLVPVYPVFGAYMQTYTGAIVRGDYDTSTIIASYDGDNADAVVTDEPLALVDTPTPTEDTLIPLATTIPVTPDPVEPIISPEKTVTQTTIVPVVDKKRPFYFTHIVKSGDTLGGISQKYNISIATLRSSNQLTDDRLRLSQKIVIPRIDGVSYIVQKGDTISTISQKYGIKNSTDIFFANDLPADTVLSVGRSLILPRPTRDPVKEAKIALEKKQQEEQKKQQTVQAKKTPEPKKSTPTKKTTTVNKVISYGSYTLTPKVDSGCRSFAWGNCTCFVAKYKNVTWRGNAKQWYANAQKQGVSVGQEARPGAIVVYSGYGFPPAYGHVAIVMEVDEEEGTFILKDMNYRALNEITTRKDTLDNPAIVGYIYVD